MRFLQCARQYCHLQLTLGDVYTARRVISAEMVDQFVTLVGDNNPIHTGTIPLDQQRVPGALLNGLVSGLIGSHFPGSGSLVVGQEYAFPNKCIIGQEIDFTLQLVQYRKIIQIAYDCQQNGVVVLKGVAKIINRKVSAKTKSE